MLNHNSSIFRNINKNNMYKYGRIFLRNYCYLCTSWSITYIGKLRFVNYFLRNWNSFKKFFPVKHRNCKIKTYSFISKSPEHSNVILIDSDYIQLDPLDVLLLLQDTFHYVKFMYFLNVVGKVFETVLLLINNFSKILVCFISSF